MRYLPSLTVGASGAMAKYLSERENRADAVFALSNRGAVAQWRNTRLNGENRADAVFAL